MVTQVGDFEYESMRLNETNALGPFKRRYFFPISYWRKLLVTSDDLSTGRRLYRLSVDDQNALRWHDRRAMSLFD